MLWQEASSPLSPEFAERRLNCVGQFGGEILSSSEVHPES